MGYETLSAGSPPLLHHQPPPATEYDVALLDLDGVVYTGQGAVPQAVPALAQARKAGQRLAFVTNNASRSPSAVAAHLTRLGVPATAEDVVTSAQAAASLIAERVPPGSPVLVAGAMGLRLALRARGLRPVSVAAERPLAVVQGYAPDMSYGLLAEAAMAVRAGALFVGANADLTLPSPRGLQPGNGSMLQVIATSTGVQPIVAGKPEPPLHAEAVARTGARKPLVVGDRLDTDIEGAAARRCRQHAGADRRQHAVQNSCSPRRLSGRPTSAPTCAACSSPRQPSASSAAPTRSRSGMPFGARAGPPGGSTSDGQIDLTGDGEAIDGLRALCALAWSGPQITAEQADTALKVLKDRL